jgi:hypothetical protein
MSLQVGIPERPSTVSVVSARDRQAALTLDRTRDLDLWSQVGDTTVYSGIEDSRAKINKNRFKVKGTWRISPGGDIGDFSTFAGNSPSKIS